MPAKRYGFAGLVPTGFEKITSANSTALTLNSTSQTCAVLDISVETQAMRYRFDSTSATTTTGVLLQKDTTYRWEGLDGGDRSTLTFIKSAGGTSILNVQGYKYTGTP